MNLPGSDERWENWFEIPELIDTTSLTSPRMQFVQSRMVPPLTPKGFELVQTPPDVAKKLQDAIAAAVQKWDEIPTERNVDVIYNRLGLLPKFVNLNGLEHEVHRALLPMHEAWVGGMKLIPTSIYGVRLYPNGSSLVMHNDKVHTFLSLVSLSLSLSRPLSLQSETHVISSIVHIAHEYDDDNEPWPIQIEDHDGNLHSVNLEPGQVLPLPLLCLVSHCLPLC
jgi:hypothetical protein